MEVLVYSQRGVHQVIRLKLWMHVLNITATNSQYGRQDIVHIETQQENGFCDHLYSPALTSQGSYVMATGVSRKWEGG